LFLAGNRRRENKNSKRTWPEFGSISSTRSEALADRTGGAEELALLIAGLYSSQFTEPESFTEAANLNFFQ
jgi:hypothetical protein